MDPNRKWRNTKLEVEKRDSKPGDDQLKEKVYMAQEVTADSTALEGTSGDVD